MKYIHKEAFSLMWYACECGHRERIWNSRDGVTPFGGVPCVSCGSGFEPRLTKSSGLRHVDFHCDACEPHHRLQVGQLYFRDGTAVESTIAIMERIIAFAAAGQPIPIGIQEQLLADARAQTGEWWIGWPKLDRWDQARQNAVKVGSNG